jgi:hypothetical protein
MTEEKLEQATAYLSGVRGAEMALNRLDSYKPNATSFSIKIGNDYMYIDNELAEQIVKLATDYFQKKKSECQQKFDAL